VTKFRPHRPTFMTTAELVAAGESLYGSRWRTPLAKAVNIGTRMLWYYERGLSPIPERCAERIRKLADIGLIGLVIRSSIRRTAPELTRFQSHNVAVEVLKDLKAAGII